MTKQILRETDDFMTDSNDDSDTTKDSDKD